LRVLRELLYFKPEDKKTNISTALEYLSNVVRKRSIVFLVSDFISEDFSKALKVVNKKHDIVTVSITDPREKEIPDIGFIELEDAETGEIIAVDSTDPELRNLYSINNSKEKEERDKLFKSMNVDSIDISTDRSYIEPLIKFFRIRAKRFM